MFVQGKIGFIEALPPTVDQIATENPDLNYEMAPIPTKDGSPVTLGVADHLMAFKNDDSKQESIQTFLDYFYSTDVYNNFVTTEKFLPVTESGAEAFENPDLQVFLDALPERAVLPQHQPRMGGRAGRVPEPDRPDRPGQGPRRRARRDPGEGGRGLLTGGTSRKDPHRDCEAPTRPRSAAVDIARPCC